MFENYKHIYDLSKILDENTQVFPGDLGFTQETICTLKNHAFELRYLHLCNHNGTHIDFPSHVINQGKTSSNYAVTDLMGKCTIIDYAKLIHCEQGIKQQLKLITLQPFVFFKNVEYLSDVVVDYLLTQAIKLVGVDCLSVDKISNEQLTIHNKLLRNDVLIVENLNLVDIDAGEGYTVIAPLNIANIDGVQARVILWR